MPTKDQLISEHAKRAYSEAFVKTMTYLHESTVEMEEGDFDFGVLEELEFFENMDDAERTIYVLAAQAVFYHILDKSLEAIGMTQGEWADHEL